MPNINLTRQLLRRPLLFKAPKFDSTFVSAIKKIAPQFDFEANEKCRKFWETEQNATCWGEYECLRHHLQDLNPTRVLEVGPGLGRSVVFFKKKLAWKDVHFDLYDGNASTHKKIDYSLLQPAPTSNSSFYGNLGLLRKILKFNDIKSFKIIDAKKNGKKLKLRDLPGPYQFIYSFYSVGFHWSIDEYLPDILGLLDQGGLAVFLTFPDYKPSKALLKCEFEFVDYLSAWPAGRLLKMILIRKQTGSKSGV